MKKSRGAIPSLADLSHGGASAVPLELVNRWTEGDRSPEQARALLDPFRIQGLVAASDMCGLSRMTERLPLHQVLRLTSLPKEWIHGMTTAIGGRAIGTWVADNTQTFFPDAINPDQVLKTLLELHRRLPANLPENGFCLHHGDFYYVGGNLYGADAELVEHLAEEHTTARETLVTESAVARLRNRADFRLSPRGDLAQFGRVYRAVEVRNSIGPGSPLGPAGYPAPFPEEIRRALGGTHLEESVLEPYRFDRSVLLVSLCRGAPPSSAADLLNGLVDAALMELISRRALPDPTAPLKTGGRIAITVAGDAGQALVAARNIRRACADEGLTVCCGIDSGPVLVFRMPDGRWEFAGEPVNIASKQAEDCGSPGWIYLTLRAAKGLSLPEARPCKWRISGVEIKSLALPPDESA